MTLTIQQRLYMRQYLKNVLQAFHESNNVKTHYRLLGAMEATLSFLGALKPGAPLPYIEVQTRGFFHVGERRETYEELILRLAREA